MTWTQQGLSKNIVTPEKTLQLRSPETCQTIPDEADGRGSSLNKLGESVGTCLSLCHIFATSDCEGKARNGKTGWKEKNGGKKWQQQSQEVK